MDENLIFALLQIANNENSNVVDSYAIKYLLEGEWIKQVSQTSYATYYTPTEKGIEYLTNVETNLMWWENPEIVDWRRFQREGH